MLGGDAGGGATAEGIEDDVIGVGGSGDDALEEGEGFSGWGSRGVLWLENASMVYPKHHPFWCHVFHRVSRINRFFYPHLSYDELFYCYMAEIEH